MAPVDPRRRDSSPALTNLPMVQGPEFEGVPQEVTGQFVLTIDGHEATPGLPTGRYDRAVANLQAIYYRASDGSEPVNEFIDGMDPKRQVALDNQIDRLNMLTPASPHLPFPHSSQVRGELRELRCHYGRELYRVLYRRSRNLIVLLHAFRKDKGALPESEIRIAQQRWTEFKARMDALKRKPPRAAGHDAP